jgi:hypothetical protein
VARDPSLLHFAFLLTQKSIFSHVGGIEVLYKFPGMKETMRILLVDINEPKIQNIASESISEMC